MERNPGENRTDISEKFCGDNTDSSSGSDRGSVGSSCSGSSAGDHTHCDSNSTSEEGRLRRLFQTCDSDGDGFIDGHDLLAVCRELNMEEAVQDIMVQLGAGETGRISCQEFISCQRKLKGEISSLAKQDSGLSSHPSLGELDAKLEGQGSVGMGSDPNVPQSLNKYGSWPNSDNSLASSAARESWERDSGARDMSPEPGAFLQKLMESANSSSGGNFLEVANTLHLAALASLKGEIIELNNRLQRVSSERDVLDKKLGKAQVERSRLLRENEDRLDQQAIRYEERITELHSVIAELNKKIDRSHGTAFREEDEFSQSASSPHSNISNSGGSCNGSFHGSDPANIDQCNDLSAELSRVVGELECAVEERKGNDNYRQHIDSADHAVQQLTSASHQVEQRSLEVVKEVEGLQFDSTSTDHSTPNGFQSRSHNNRRRSSLEQEIGVLQDENENLNTTLSMKDDELQKIKANLIAIRDERDRLRKRVREYQSRSSQQLSGAAASNLKQQQQHQQGYTSSSSDQLSSPGYRATPTPSTVPNGVNPSTGELSVYGSERRGGMPVAKVAERVRLKPSRSDSSSRSGSERGLTGADLSSIGVANPKVAEHLAQSLQECSSVQEILQAMSTHGLSIPENKARDIEVEMERLNSKIEHLKSQNDLLQLSLEESKCSADRLTMLVGKYESNNTALQLAVNYCDQTVEAYEVLLMLCETEQQVVLANCRAAGVGGIGTGESSEGSDTEETTMVLKRVHENRKSAENMAKALLQRLDRSCGTMVCHVPGCTLQPWEDVSSHSHTSTTSSTASSCDTEFSKEDEQRLRDYIQQLKNDKSAVRLTVMELESVYIDPMSQEVMSSSDSQRLDLENAVLMQEIAALKEEKAELKAQYYLLEKEKKSAELKMSSRDAREMAYLAQIDHLKSEVQDKKMVPKGHKSAHPTPMITLAELSQLDDPNISLDMAEMLRREKKLRSKIHELMATIEKLQKSSEMRHQQSAEFITDLKRANSALVTAYDKAKKKHQNRLKKLEAQMMAMVERHDTQVRMLKQRIALLEEENQASRPPHNETSL